MKDMPTGPQIADREPAHSIHEHAAANLRFIRATLEHAGSFTAVPGRGGMVMGATALVAAAIAARQSDPRAWFIVWVVEAFLASLIGGGALLLKIRHSASSLDSMPFRRFLLAYVPGMLAGGIITFLLYSHGWYEPLPGLWLLLYGAAVTAGGAMSIRIVPVMGALFMLLGVGALLLPTWGTIFMASGFGLLHLGFGWAIAKHHGG
jgi:hypothetical protein